TAPAGPAGELGVAGVDADELAVLRAAVNAPALDRGLKAKLSADLVGLRDLALLWLDLQHVALQRREEDLAARGGGRGGEESAFLFEVAFELEAPELVSGLRVGAEEFVAHAVVVLAARVQEARALERLHRRDIPLADISLGRVRVRGLRRPAGEAIPGIELPAKGLLLRITLNLVVDVLGFP